MAKVKFAKESTLKAMSADQLKQYAKDKKAAIKKKSDKEKALKAIKALKQKR